MKRCYLSLAAVVMLSGASLHSASATIYQTTYEWEEYEQPECHDTAFAARFPELCKGESVKVVVEFRHSEPIVNNDTNGCDPYSNPYACEVSHFGAPYRILVTAVAAFEGAEADGFHTDFLGRYPSQDNGNSPPYIGISGLDTHTGVRISGWGFGNSSWPMEITFKDGRRYQMDGYWASRRNTVVIEPVPFSYHYLDIGTLGGTQSWPVAINNLGQVAGIAETASGQAHAFIFQEGAISDIGTLGGTYSRSAAINNSGEVTGVSVTQDGVRAAFLYSGGQTKNLGSLGGEQSEGYDINEFGEITGWAYDKLNAPRLFIFRSGSMIDGGGLSGHASTGYAINDLGQAVGEAEETNGAHVAILSDGGTLVRIGALGGHESYAKSINSAGQVTGAAKTAIPGQEEDGPYHAFFFDSGVIRDVGTLGGATSVGRAINESGDITGAAETADRRSHAFLYRKGVLSQINLSESLVSNGRAINESGHIVGQVTRIWGDQRGFVYRDGLSVDLTSFLDPALGLTVRDAFAINDLGQIAANVCDAQDKCRAARFDPVRSGAYLADFTLSKTTVPGCASVTGTVTLSQPAPAGGLIVTVTDNLTAVSSSTNVLVREGEIFRNFPVRTSAVSRTETGSVFARFGDVKFSQPLRVRPIGVVSLSLTPNPAVGGSTVNGLVKLECMAGPGPVTVELGSSNSAAADSVAASIVVPQGLQTAPFDVQTKPVPTRATTSVSAIANGVTRSRLLTVTPAASVSPTSLKFGGVAVGTISGVLSATLTNRGALAFSVSNISLAGAYASWFSQSHNCPASLPAGASCTIAVKFKPVAALTKSAKVSIATSATSTPLSVSLSGTGL